MVALIFMPVLGGIFGKQPAHDEEHERAIEASETGDWRDIPGITGWYAHWSERLTRHPGRVIVGAVGIVFAVFTLFAVFNHGVDLLRGRGTPDFTQVFISARGNLSADEKRDIVMEISRIVQTVPGIRAIYASSGGQSNSLNSQGGIPVDNIGGLNIEMKDYRLRRPAKWIEEEIRRKTANMPGVHVEVRQPQQGPPTGKDVMVDVYSDDYVQLAQAAAMLRAYIDKLPELRDVEDTRPLPASSGTSQSIARSRAGSAPMRRRSARPSSSSPTACWSENTVPTIPMTRWTSECAIRARPAASMRSTICASRRPTAAWSRSATSSR